MVKDKIVKDKVVNKKWYVVHTKTGYEDRVKASLLNKIEVDGKKSLFSQVLIPTESVAEIKAGEKKISQRKFFPGYVFIEMELNDKTWSLVKDTSGVTNFVGSKTSPVSLSEEEVKNLLKKTKERKEKPAPKVIFSVGESVKIADGPFANFNGTVEEVSPDKGKMKVMVTIFGRSTPVEFEYWQVEKL